MRTDLQTQINQLNKRVEDLEIRLSAIVLKSNSSAPSPPLSGGSGKAWVITKKIEAWERIMDGLKRKSTIEVATGTKWQSENARKEYLHIKKVVEALNAQLASL
jgi:hypothetical protein